MTIQPDKTPDAKTDVPAVRVDHLSFRYRSLDDEPGQASSKETSANAIEDISFTLPAGELLLIAGPSGCGKSTLLKCLNGLIPHSYIVGLGFASLVDAFTSAGSPVTTLTTEFVPAFLSDTVFAIVLLPILLVAYNAALGRSGRS